MSELGENIKNLRTAWGLTQKELGDAIHVSDTAIANYERGDRIPKIEVLQDIASYLCVSVDQLVHGDFTDANFDFSPMTSHTLSTFFDRVLPIICSDAALNDPHFVEAHKHTVRFAESMKSFNTPILASNLSTAFNEYKTSLKTYHTTESAANILWIIFVQYCLIPDSHINKVAQAVSNGIGKKQGFVKNYILVNSNSVDQQAAERKRKYAKRYHHTLLKMIGILKASPQYQNLGDYYVALMYIYGLVDNQETFDINQTIGMKLMGVWAELNNDYANEYLDASLSLLELHEM